jgi:hypothetical protein
MHIRRYISTVVFVGLIVLVGLPMFAGFIFLAFGTNGVSSTGNTYLSQGSLIGVALLEIALAGLLLWFIPKEEVHRFGTKAVIRSSAKFLLVGAAFLVMVTLLSPVIPIIKDRNDWWSIWWSIFIRYFTAIGFVVGGMSLVFSVVSCICFAWEL